MRLNPYIAIMIGLSILIGGLLVFSGCRKKAAPKKPPLETATVEEGAVPAVAPFPGSVEKTAARIAESARDTISDRSGDNLGKLYVSGFAILVIAVALKLVTGSWRDSFIVSGLGMVPAVGAVLLTDFPRVVLLIPITWVVVLIVFGIRKLAEWRTKARGFDVVAPVIEEGDTGPKSWGQKAKDAVKDSGLGSVVDKALKPLEELWKKHVPTEQ